MKILKETNVEYVKMDVDFENTEYETLLNYGKTKIPTKVLDDLILEWAFVEAIKNGIKKEIKKKKATKTKK